MAKHAMNHRRVIRVLDWIAEERHRLDLSITRLQRAGKQVQAAHQRGRAAGLADVAEQLLQGEASHDTPSGLATAWAAAQQAQASRESLFKVSQESARSRQQALNPQRGIW